MWQGKAAMARSGKVERSLWEVLAKEGATLSLPDGNILKQACNRFTTGPQQACNTPRKGIWQVGGSVATGVAKVLSECCRGVARAF